VRRTRRPPPEDTTGCGTAFVGALVMLFLMAVFFAYMGWPESLKP
jgi:hypothetical protein